MGFVLNSDTMCVVLTHEKRDYIKSACLELTQQVTSDVHSKPIPCSVVRGLVAYSDTQISKACSDVRITTACSDARRPTACSDAHMSNTCRAMYGTEHRVKIRSVAHIIGLFVASFPAVQFGQLYYRALKRDKIAALTIKRGNYEAKMAVSDKAVEELKSHLAFNVTSTLSRTLTYRPR